MKPYPFVGLNHLTVPVDISPSWNETLRRGGAVSKLRLDRTGSRSRAHSDKVGPRSIDLPDMVSPIRSFHDAGLISKEAVWRVGIEWCQSRIEAEPRRAVGTEDRVRVAHIDVDVRVVLRRGHADALEFPHPDADFRDATVVPELRIAAAGHRLRPL